MRVGSLDGLGGPIHTAAKSHPARIHGGALRMFMWGETCERGPGRRGHGRTLLWGVPSMDAPCSN